MQDAVVMKSLAQQIFSYNNIIFCVYYEMFANYFIFFPATRRDMNVIVDFAVNNSVIKLSSIISDKALISTNSTGCLDLNLVQTDLALLAPVFACD